ncbi:DUF3152 domain-containing protein [Bifidobacterium xylocopae]|uniref:DUF3152 domain-containing protein n=1 Tax=Bifidobacterium xylocopae TaxID=2493119 RepID=UPI001F3E5531|nr:DUF3152 domain-containing protein [Bifidobacterium xylocopae]
MSPRQADRIFRVRRFVVAFLAVIVVVCLLTAMAVSGHRRSASAGAVASASGADHPGSVEHERGPAGGRARRPAAGDLTKAPVPRSEQAQPATLTERERSEILAQAQATAAASGRPRHDFTYCVAGRGNVGNTTVFEQTVFRTLNDPRGWPRAGASFTRWSGGACDMVLVLAEPQYMRTFSPACSPEYSCRVGNQVIVNKVRWDGGTDYWLGAGGDMGRYRVMVINHEVGHRLGHMDNEQTCAGAGQSAPLMQEQSMGLKGCKPNEWPMDSELWIR